MNDLPPDLARLRTLETWLQLNLARVRQQIAAVEQREQQPQQTVDRRPPPPEWTIEQSLNRDSAPLLVHVGGCWATGKRHRGIRRDQALRALAEGVAPCPHCRPDSELGFVDG